MKNFDEIVFVLDESGSMGYTRSATISSFNEFVTSQAKEGKARLSLYSFSSVAGTRLYTSNVKKVKPLSSTTYRPNGMTALYDTIGTAIEDTEKRIIKTDKARRPDKVIVVILTDGMENSSRDFDKARINDLINKKREQDWQFIYLGANQDAIEIAAQMGIDAESSLTYQQTDAGIGFATQDLTHSVLKYRSASPDVAKKMRGGKIALFDPAARSRNA